MKILEAFEKCDDDQKDECLFAHMLPNPPPRNRSLASRRWRWQRLRRSCSKLPPDAAVKDEQEATRFRVLNQLLNTLPLSDEEKIQIAQRLLINHPNPRMVGTCLSSVLVGKVPQHKEAIAGFAERLSADSELPTNETDPLAVLDATVLKELRKGLGPDPQVVAAMQRALQDAQEKLQQQRKVAAQAQQQAQQQQQRAAAKEGRARRRRRIRCRRPCRQERWRRWRRAERRK